MTQTGLAARMDRPQSFVAKVEVGERRLDVMEFIAYAAALGMKAPDLLMKVLEAESLAQDTPESG